MKVTIYTITDCQFSKQEKDYLASHNIPYEEKNLETNKDFLTEMLAVSNNFAGTPVTKVEKDDGQIVVLKGFTQSEFDGALGISAAMPGMTPVHADAPVAAAPTMSAPVADPMAGMQAANSSVNMPDLPAEPAVPPTPASVPVTTDTPAAPEVPAVPEPVTPAIPPAPEPEAPVVPETPVQEAQSSMSMPTDPAATTPAPADVAEVQKEVENLVAQTTGPLPDPAPAEPVPTPPPSPSEPMPPTPNPVSTPPPQVAPSEAPVQEAQSSISMPAEPPAPTPAPATPAPTDAKLNSILESLQSKVTDTSATPATPAAPAPAGGMPNIPEPDFK